MQRNKQTVIKDAMEEEEEKYFYWASKTNQIIQ